MTKRVAELLGTSDAGRILDLSSAMVRLLADKGTLRVAATTPKGGRLFRREDVEALERDRAKAREQARLELNA